MAQGRSVERRRVLTRREIARAALELFVRDGYDAVSLEAIAEASGMSLRSLYRYVSAKDEILNPILNEGSEELVELIARRPASESMATAVQRAYEEYQPADDEGPRDFIALLVAVPALRSRWLDSLRRLEDTLAPVVQQRAPRPVSAKQAHLTAAAVVVCLRVVLESALRPGADPPSPATLGDALSYLKGGAGL